ncbi:MAG: hypothetical protein ABIM44_01795 [candidate division WOR-3 bacterium]
MPDEEEHLEEEYENYLISFRLFKKIFLRIIKNPKKAFLEVKNYPNILSVVIILPLLAGTIFLQHYILYRIKMIIPSPLYVEQINSFIDSLLLIQPLRYISFMVFSVFLTLAIFMIGGRIGGYGNIKHGISVTGYVYTSNLLGFTAATLLVLSIPAIQTGVLPFIGYPIEGKPNENIVIRLNDYVGENSNLTISFYAHYLVPPEITIQNNIITESIRIISGEIGDFKSEIKVEYAVDTSNGINRTVKITSLKDMVFNYSTPLEIKDVFSFNDHGKRFKIDLILFLNNTCIFPLKDNISVPYILVLNVFNSNETMKIYEIRSSVYKNVSYYPDPRPFYNILITIQVFSLVATIWQIILLATSFKVIHEFTLFKTVGIMLLYSIAKLFLIGFVV